MRTAASVLTAWVFMVTLLAWYLHREPHPDGHAAEILVVSVLTAVLLAGTIGPFGADGTRIRVDDSGLYLGRRRHLPAHRIGEVRVVREREVRPTVVSTWWHEDVRLHPLRLAYHRREWRDAVLVVDAEARWRPGWFFEVAGRAEECAEVLREVARAAGGLSLEEPHEDEAW
jgi:hypothetical protein